MHGHLNVIFQKYAKMVQNKTQWQFLHHEDKSPGHITENFLAKRAATNCSLNIIHLFCAKDRRYTIAENHSQLARYCTGLGHAQNPNVLVMMKKHQ